MLSEDQIQGKWKELKGHAKKQWGKLTDDDLDVAEGKRDILIGRIQQRYGKTKEQAKKEVEDFFDDL